MNLVETLRPANGAGCNVSTNKNKYSEIAPKIGSLSAIIRAFKSAVSKNIHQHGFPEFSWQARFYDRIIRDENKLYNIRKYIRSNPAKWEFEKNNPENICDL